MLIRSLQLKNSYINVCLLYLMECNFFDFVLNFIRRSYRILGAKKMFCLFAPALLTKIHASVLETYPSLTPLSTKAEPKRKQLGLQ